MAVTFRAVRSGALQNPAYRPAGSYPVMGHASVATRALSNTCTTLRRALDSGVHADLFAFGELRTGFCVHASSSEKVRLLREHYLAACEQQPLSILDVGSAVIGPQPNSNRTELFNPNWSYTGLDIEPGSNVDLIPSDIYDWRNVADASYDIVVCSQVFEHTQFFWITITEIARVLKPFGLLFLMAPSSGPLHRYPYDCWRFYEDGLPTLATWADLDVIESAVQRRPVYSADNHWRDATLLAQRPLRDAVEEIVARRGAYGRAALTGKTPDHSQGKELLPSAIGPLASKKVLSAYENALIEKLSIGYKLSLMNRHWRRMWKVLRTPAAQIIDQ